MVYPIPPDIEPSDLFPVIDAAGPSLRTMSFEQLTGVNVYDEDKWISSLLQRSQWLRTVSITVDRGWNLDRSQETTKTDLNSIG